MAHQIMEAVGNGCRLDEVLYSGDLIAPQDQIGINKDDIEDVRNYLSLLKDHPLVKEMELALESRNEYEITKPFGEYILYGRLDKVIKTAEGWKILDFKFSRSESHSEAHDFQMKFYLYLAREIFSPLLGAELFYLKDGISRLVLLGDENIPNFQEYLDERIEEYQRAFKVNLE
ncbi:MAG: PD-(D/E)XK nuclease superfamily protein [Methanosaeta sp. PtaU1.Bin112]|nr:MAG: PD-(D/E)XK nuclease superfamily protein [Methanosaeta sp. PtaU1.Bin112]